MALISSLTLAVEKPITISCTSPRGLPDADYTAEVMAPVMKQHGFNLAFKTGQGPAVVEGLRQGKFDGDCGRIESFNEKTGLNLIRVEPAIRRVRFALWGFDVDFPLHQVSPDKLRVGYLATTQISPVLAAQMGFTNLHRYDSMGAMVAALLRGEINVMLNYQALVNGYNDQSKKMLYRLRHLVTFPVYIYLQPRYQFMVPDLSAAIVSRVKVKPYNPYPDKVIPPLSEGQIIFGCSVPKHSQAFFEMEQGYRRAFNKMGYGFQMLAMPRARESAELLGGEVDGTCARGNVSPYNDHESLLRIRMPVTKTQLKIYSRRPAKQVQDLGQLPEGATIAYVRGTQLAELILKRAPHIKPVGVNNAELGVKMLAGERVDYFIGFPAASDYVLNNLDIRKMLYVVSDLPPIFFYAYIHTRHKALREPLEQHFKAQIQAQGSNAFLPYLEEMLDVEARE
ncbi:hypothetical protein R50073_28600 [Maricurvus nonylphenolicus]